MDTLTRNKIFLENEDMINHIIRRNRTLILALKLDRDDVYQELAIAALKAIDAFDPTRSERIQAHIWMQLQYALLDMKRKHHAADISLDYAEKMGYLSADATEPEQCLSPELRRALSLLDETERKAVVRYLNGEKPPRRSFDRALGKLRSCYVVTASC